MSRPSEGPGTKKIIIKNVKISKILFTIRLAVTSSRVSAQGRTLFVTVSLTGVTAVMLMVVRGGRGVEKLKVGKAEVLMGSEMVGRSGTLAN